MKTKLLRKASILQEIYVLRCLRKKQNMLKKDIEQSRFLCEFYIYRQAELNKINSSLENDEKFLKEKIKYLTTNIAILAGINYFLKIWQVNNVKI